jgi:hypothetical protein
MPVTITKGKWEPLLRGQSVQSTSDANLLCFTAANKKHSTGNGWVSEE